ncbi:hypothetical protein A3C28_03795 [Candidatus Roizmanbacteria bacterium RIFCSPHIGHO2_02_FULL_39_9]|uniref:VTC domain-containing protein n=1 Tax=Candidatus Roizmanbacteria bacterium RIFCSPHIGHO2_02_FULL_39_9 TaxID=1802040 RepID=A0A1F7H5S3_9BACT|nr:MAG: hypothetical protein A3C28_03795 [Candidatus Roizmanbacteria bacterium RIFCSPHIGHO2_02_FULL_39_9]
MKTEYKYFIPRAISSFILANLKNFIISDPYSGEGGSYRVSSVYLETLNMTSYLDKLNGLSKRLKLRVRWYPSGTHLFNTLELKYKIYDKLVKKRFPVDTNTLKKILLNDHEQTGKDCSDGIQKFILLKKANAMYPFIRIDYIRRAYVGKVDKNVRITFDQDIRCCRYVDFQSLPTIPSLPSRSVIMEIKSHGYFPTWLTYIIKKYGLQRAAISKYVSSVQRLAYNSSLLIK